MKQLVPMDNYGVFADSKDTARANSLIVAQMFEKRHDHVIRAIENITAPNSGASKEFRERNFALSSYKDSSGRKVKCYEMTRDGFTVLAMGFTGKKSMQFKEAYINRFNEMEKFIATIVSTRRDYPILTDAIKVAYDDPKPYHFSNEADMLNKLITGYTAKDFRIKHGIEKGKSIRPYLTQEQIKLMELLQKVDTGLLISVPDFHQRKRHLEWYIHRHAKQLSGNTA